MYCSNCGEKVYENAVVCVHCGCAINRPLHNQRNINNTNNTNGKSCGKGIASMVLGIIGILFSFIYFINLIGIIDGIFYGGQPIGYKLGVGIGSILLPLIFFSISLPLTLVERQNNKNGFNTAGLILDCIIGAFMAIMFFLAIVS